MELKYKNTALIEDSDIKKESENLQEYLGYLNEIASKNNYDSLESLINLPFDSGIHNKIKKLADEIKTDKLKYIIVAGIGGSNLGTLAVYDAIFGNLDYLFKNRFPKIIFADTTDSSLLNSIKEILESNVSGPEEFVINLISKSGTTTETIVNFEVIFKFLKERFGEVENRVVITTDNKSEIRELAEKKGFKILEIPKSIGGKFSVFSAAGLFPLAVSGINTDELLKGAGNMRDNCLKQDADENPALISSILLYLHSKRGVKINDNFFFIPDLESLGKWYRGLISESIGKEKNLEGKVVNSGITPTVSIGSADLHSMAQLYLGGPKDKFTYFINTSQNKFKVSVPKNLVFPGLVSGIENKELDEIMSAILDGVKKAYQKKGLPFAEVILPDTSVESIGEFMQWKMIEIMLLAKLLNVNPYDQPNVEEYKEETRKILSQ